MPEKQARKIKIKLVILLLGLSLTVLYKVSLYIPGFSEAIFENFTAPIHRSLSHLCDFVSFSVGELLIALVVVAFTAYTVFTIISVIRRKQRLHCIILWILACAILFSWIYGGFCILWGTYYSVSDSDKIFGFSSDGVEHEDLIKVDKYFVELANEYSTKVDRDENGHYVADTDAIFEHSYNLYDSLEKEYPNLASAKHKAKPVVCSKIMSYIGFTGFFFPFTGEANINMDSPQMMVPATIAHELAHQRGVAAEDEANFTAILACLTDEDDDFVYSASLLALIHLQNALYKSGDKDTWQEIRDTYSDEVKNDLAEHSKYWQKYDKTVANKVSSNTYDAFLKSYNQTLGKETYGACVNLLVDYFK